MDYKLRRRNNVYRGRLWLLDMYTWEICHTAVSRAIELFVGSTSFKLYGDEGKFYLPEPFINLVKAASDSTEINLKFKTASGSSAVAPVGPATVKVLKDLFAKAIPRWEKPNLKISLQAVSKENSTLRILPAKRYLLLLCWKMIVAMVVALLCRLV